MKLKWYWVCWKCGGKMFGRSSGPTMLSEYSKFGDMDKFNHAGKCGCRSTKPVLASMSV